MAERGPSYDLVKSRVKIGELYKVIEDAHGNLIDGYNRLEAVPEWGREKRDHIKTPTQLWLARLTANAHRRNVPKKERVIQISELSRCLMKEEGVSKEDLIPMLVDLTTFSRSYIYSILPDEFKQHPRPVKPEEEDPLRKGMTPEEILRRYEPGRYDDEFLIFQLITFSDVKVKQAEEIVNKWRKRGVSSKIEEDKKGKRSPRSSTISNSDAVAKTFSRLTEYYPASILDDVMKLTPSTNFQTLVKYCRSYLSRLHEKISLDLRQTVLKEFNI